MCRAERTPVVPYGGGSGVCGGVAVPEGAIVLSTARMAGLVDLDARNLTATFLAGTGGMDAERLVEGEGLTIGHWPQSIDVSTVGGWVATRASGQYSTAYGSIEDLVLDLEAVLPDGSVVRTRRTPRASTGPDLRQIFLGSEGIFGVVTEVTFSLRPLPEASRGQAFHFESLPAGIEPIRRLMRAGWRPPVVRLYDALESGRHFPGACPEERAMLILLHEGPASLVDVERAAVGEICSETGGVEADAAVVDNWLATRNDVPGFRPFLEKGIILDTIEVACTWSRVAELYERAIDLALRGSRHPARQRPLESQLPLGNESLHHLRRAAREARADGGDLPRVLAPDAGRLARRRRRHRPSPRDRTRSARPARRRDRRGGGGAAVVA